MRIVHVLTRIEGGGTEKNLAASLASEREQGHNCAVISGFTNPIHRASIEEHAEIIMLEPLQRPVHPVRDTEALRALRGLLRRYDVVHSHQSKAGALTRVAAPKRSVRIHTVHMASFGPGYSKQEHFVYSAIERALSPRTDFLCFVGQELRDTYAAKGITGRTASRVIRSAIDVESFEAARTCREVKTASKRQLLAVGALEPRKRYDLMLDLVAPTLRRAVDVSLDIAGEGPVRHELKARAESLGIAEKVTFVGHVSDLPARMARARVLLHTSAAEGVPQAVLQAAIAGLPVLATRSEGLLEVGNGAVQVVHRDGGSFGKLLEDLLANENSKVVPLGHFDKWRPEQVKAAYGGLLRDVENYGQSRRGWTRVCRPS